jgi:lysophospholipase L1-like esterase
VEWHWGENRYWPGIENQKSKMIRPYHILFFLASLFVMSLFAAWVWPKEGIPMTREWSLKFASLSEIFPTDSGRLDFDKLFYFEIDSTDIKDSLRLAALKYRQKVMRIQYPEGHPGLVNFFRALDLRKRGVGKVRILHYGDSQLEGDRMTNVIRNEFQKLFGGSGTGYIAACPLVDNISVNNRRSANWVRYPVFGITDSTRSTHNHFGMYGVFSRFTPIPKHDTIIKPGETFRIHAKEGHWYDSTGATTMRLIPILPKDTTRAWVSLSMNSSCYAVSKKFTRVTVLFRNPDAAFKLALISSDSSRVRRTFPVNANAQSFTHTFETTPDFVRLEFKALSSPDVMGIRLETEEGIVMDNVALRGSSGNIFTQINQLEMAPQMAAEPIKLIILQFGGNTVPYMEDEERVYRYGRTMGNQIKLLKRLNPEADFVLIGPSDMSVKEKTNYVTYPILPIVRDALKHAAFENGIGYWDMYEVMGGKNSMPAWVNADPPLAAPDYVHFTRPGANKMAKLFFDALMKDYDKYLGKSEEGIQ